MTETYCWLGGAALELESFEFDSDRFSSRSFSRLSSRFSYRFLNRFDSDRFFGRPVDSLTS